jgi:DNA-binding NarL/FixJ family response regulator
MVSVQKTAKRRLLAVNERGYVVGEQHHRAKLTDHEVTLVLELLDSGMSERRVAEKMEISRRTVRDYKAAKTRAQTPYRWLGADKRHPTR